MTRTKVILSYSGIFVGVLTLFFLFGLYSLGWMKFFEPKRENIRREIWEQMQSRVHGVVQDLAKYKYEYEKADSNGKEVIRQVILQRFAQFDEKKIESENLRNFLTRMRGY